jgi:MFS family permease
LTGELYRPASSALLADLTPAGQRVTAYAVYRLAFNAGWAFGPATAGFLATHSFFWLFLGDAVTSALFGLVALAALPRSPRISNEGDGWADGLKAAAGDSQFRRLLVASLAIALVFFQMNSTFGLHVRGLGFSATTYGLLLSLNGVLVVCFELFLTSFTQRFEARRTMAAGYALVGIGFALNAWAKTVPGLALAMSVFTFGEMVAMPVSSAYLADLAPAPLRGRYIGLLGLTWALGLICGPAFGMAVYHYSPALLWCSCGGLGLVAAWLILQPGRARSPVAAMAERP